MKNVLVITYSQSGQTTEIVKSVLQALEADPSVKVHYEFLELATPFPFPWTSNAFFQAFPETYKEIPFELKPFKFDDSIDYDLVVIGYQVWYLSPSIPINSFVVSEQGIKLLKSKPVITINGARNMWVVGHEKMKAKLLNAQAKLVGNIALVDRSPNLVSVITILRWMLTGKKEPFWKVFPKPGVSDHDIKRSSQFGEIIRKSLHQDINSLQQSELNRLGAVSIFPNLILLERRANKLFAPLAEFIYKKGAFMSEERSFRVKLFRTYLFVGIFILSPITTIISWLIGIIFKNKIEKQVNYLMSNDFKADMILNNGQS